MGAASYRRGSQVIAVQIERQHKPIYNAFRIMDRINSLPKFGKHDKEVMPFHDTLFIESGNGGFWLMSGKLYDGYSKFYRTLEQCIRSWDIYLTGYDETTGLWQATTMDGMRQGVTLTGGNHV